MADEPEVTQATKDEDEKESKQAHESDRAPTPDEEAAADESTERYAGDRETVAEHESEMGERGANVKGEGEIK